MRKCLIFTLTFVMFICANINRLKAQEEGVTDTLPGKIDQFNADINDLKKMKISGYFQFQGQSADSAGEASVAGGNFGKNIDHRFMIRRGRIKFNYATTLTNYVLQMDITEKAVALKEFYLTYTEPMLKMFSITAGQFNRPFGYEIDYSSGLRESPELSRFVQTIFPGEVDLGAKLSIQPWKTSVWNIFKLDLGLFNGSGGNVPAIDNRWDFIGRFAFNKAIMNENFKVGLGASYYNGYFKNSPDASGVAEYQYQSSALGYTKVNNAPDYAGRKYVGIDFQLALNSMIGITQLKGEYISGTSAGSSSSSNTPSALLSGTATATTDTVLNTQGHPVIITTTKTVGAATFLRDFSGYYVYFIQDLGHTKHQLVLKYDVYDPNTKVAGTDIGKAVTSGSGAKATNAADIKYSTIGLGWIWHFNEHLKLVTYYDMVTNENTSLYDTTNKLNYKKDIKDNVLTIRLQYKF
ncbi:MAG: hypothetical protein NTW49_07205 [Bacteroidia bacterium]|nr:hypothetical protein [Bacteroidia bacterium]